MIIVSFLWHLYRNTIDTHLIHVIEGIILCILTHVHFCETSAVIKTMPIFINLQLCVSLWYHSFLCPSLLTWNSHGSVSKDYLYFWEFSKNQIMHYIYSLSFPLTYCFLSFKIMILRFTFTCHVFDSLLYCLILLHCTVHDNLFSMHLLI